MAKYEFTFQTGENVDKALERAASVLKWVRSKLTQSEQEASGVALIGWGKWIRNAFVLAVMGVAIMWLAPGFHSYDYVRFDNIGEAVCYVLLAAYAAGMLVSARLNGQLAAAAPDRLDRTTIVARALAGMREDVMHRALLVPVAMGALYLADYWVEVPLFFDNVVIPPLNYLANILTLGVADNALLRANANHLLHGMIVASLFASDTAKYKKGPWSWVNRVGIGTMMTVVTLESGLLMTLLVRAGYEAWCTVVLYGMHRVSAALPPAAPSSS